MKGLSFVDRCRIQVFAGNGGDGCASFRREKFIPKGGPDGGDGGNGGSVHIRASKDTDSLLNLYYQPLRRAEHGGKGRSKQCYGRSGADLYVDVPCGTEVRLEKSGDFIGEVIEPGDAILVAQGGKGGQGNMRFVTSSYQAPREFTLGTRGEIKNLLIELKTVADVGLVGYPNAGKSTLLAAISPAKPKIASYPFTTLHPIIGTVAYDDYGQMKIADIPGLIDGAHKGVGLGHDFLRHIVRTKYLLFVIDMAGVDGRNPVDDYRNLKKELKLYSAELAARPSMAVANKMDLPEAEANYKAFIRRARQKPFKISAALGEGVDELRKELRKRIETTGPDRRAQSLPP
jgi:GTP-binding protein